MPRYNISGASVASDIVLAEFNEATAIRSQPQLLARLTAGDHGRLHIAPNIAAAQLTLQRTKTDRQVPKKALQGGTFRVNAGAGVSSLILWLGEGDPPRSHPHCFLFPTGTPFHTHWPHIPLYPQPGTIQRRARAIGVRRGAQNPFQPRKPAPLWLKLEVEHIMIDGTTAIREGETNVYYNWKQAHLNGKLTANQVQAMHASVAQPCWFWCECTRDMNEEKFYPLKADAQQVEHWTRGTLPRVIPPPSLPAPLVQQPQPGAAAGPQAPPQQHQPPQAQQAVAPIPPQQAQLPAQQQLHAQQQPAHPPPAEQQQAAQPQAHPGLQPAVAPIVQLQQQQQPPPIAEPEDELVTQLERLVLANVPLTLGQRARLQQTPFRNAVRARDGACVITGVSQQAACEAAHLVGVEDIAAFRDHRHISDEAAIAQIMSAANGVLLRRDVHRLFDCPERLVSFAFDPPSSQHVVLRLAPAIGYSLSCMPGKDVLPNMPLPSFPEACKEFLQWKLEMQQEH